MEARRSLRASIAPAASVLETVERCSKLVVTEQGEKGRRKQNLRTPFAADKQHLALDTQPTSSPPPPPRPCPPTHPPVYYIYIYICKFYFLGGGVFRVRFRFLQVGEVVMYFPQGHEAYLRTFPENKAPPYKLFKGNPAVVRCQVRCVARVLRLAWVMLDKWNYCRREENGR